MIVETKASISFGTDRIVSGEEIDIVNQNPCWIAIVRCPLARVLTYVPISPVLCHQWTSSTEYIARKFVAWFKFLVIFWSWNFYFWNLLKYFFKDFKRKNIIFYKYKLVYNISVVESVVKYIHKQRRKAIYHLHVDRASAVHNKSSKL